MAMAKATAAPTTRFLIKYGEISLKGANRAEFENRLARNIVARLPRGSARVRKTWGRLFLEVAVEHAAAAGAALGTTFGVVAYAPVRQFDKHPDALAYIADLLAAELANGAAAADAAARQATGEATVPATSQATRSATSDGTGEPTAKPAGGSTGEPPTFKVEASREDKAFPLTSYQIACILGDQLRARAPGLTVDVHRPQVTVRVEVRDRIYAYSDQRRGLGGLPVGCSGRGLLLLSGGIDSPVAGYLMGGRGLAVEGVYFHAHPFTSPEAEEKVHRLAQVLSRYFGRFALHVVPFTPVQVRIKERAPAAEVTLLTRCAMMEIASTIATQRGHSCLITGESLGQVASQTVPSLHVTGSHAALPVLRPLIGQSKEAIIAIARQLGTFPISTLPYPDCCTLFAPIHPVINPNLATLADSYRRLELEPLLSEATAGLRTAKCGATTPL